MGVVRLVSVLVAQNAYFVNQMKELQKQVRGTLMEDATAKVLLLLVGNIFMSKLQHLQVLKLDRTNLDIGTNHMISSLMPLRELMNMSNFTGTV